MAPQTQERKREKGETQISWQTRLYLYFFVDTNMYWYGWTKYAQISEADRVNQLQAQIQTNQRNEADQLINMSIFNLFQCSYVLRNVTKPRTFGFFNSCTEKQAIIQHKLISIFFATNLYGRTDEEVRIVEGEKLKCSLCNVRIFRQFIT